MPQREAGRNDLGAKMEGQYKSELAQVVRVRVGTPEKLLRLVVSFATHVTHLPKGFSRGSTSYAGPATALASSEPLGGRGTDLVRVAGTVMRVPVTDEAPSAAVEAGMMCEECDGVLGMGAGSPYWLRWARVTVGAGSIGVGDSRGWAAADAMRLFAPTRCVDDPAALTGHDGPGSESICLVRGRVFGEEYLIDLSFWSATTVVPSRVYWAYAGTKTISPGGSVTHASSTTTAGGNSEAVGRRQRRNEHTQWDDLVIRVDGADGGHDVRIRAEDVVVDAGDGRSMLMLAPDDGEATAGGRVIRLGRSALYSIAVDIRPGERTALVYEWPVRKDFGVVSAVLMLFLVIMVLRWLMTPSDVEGDIVPLVDATGSTAVVGWLLRGGDQRTRRAFGVKVVIEAVVACVAVSVYYMTDTRAAVEPFTRFDAFAFASIACMASFECLTVVAIAGARVHWLTGRVASLRGTPINEIAVLRINVVRNSSHQLLIMLSVWMLALQTRQDSLATDIALATASVTCCIGFYYLAMAMAIPMRPCAVMWLAYVAFHACFVLACACAAGCYVFAHFAEAVLDSGDDVLVLVWTLVYVMGIAAVASWCANKTHTRRQQ